MGILDRAPGSIVFLVAEQLTQARADFLKALAEITLAVGKDVLQSAPADVARDLGLFFAGGGTAFALDLLDQRNRIDVVAGLLRWSALLGQRTGRNRPVFALYGIGSVSG